MLDQGIPAYVGCGHHHLKASFLEPHPGIDRIDDFSRITDYQ
jgi:hypothetical protein